MVSRLVKIIGTAAVIVLAGNFGYHKVNNKIEYQRVYDAFKREVSSLHTPDSNDNPTCQEWSDVCSEIGIPYDPQNREDPRPEIDKMINWLKERGVYTD
jgi:hypothetical protein